MHEMMTNAAKYGALSSSNGKLRVSWSRTPTGECEITWQESGGPVVSIPTRSGFGSKLIKSSVEYDLGGQVSIDYLPTGLVGHFQIPARHVTEPSMTRTPYSGSTHTRIDILRGLEVMMVEDQAIIAMDAEQALKALGAAQVHPFPDVSRAIAALDAIRVDAAILDFNLEGEDASALADELIIRNIPFVFVTGYGASAMMGGRFARIPIVRKPISIQDLGEKLGKAMLEVTVRSV